MKWKPDLTTVLLLAVLAFVASQWWTLRELHAGIQNVIEHYEAPMQTATTTVTNTSGISITITTTKNPDESDTDWIARHIASVNAAKAS